MQRELAVPYPAVGRGSPAVARQAIQGALLRAAAALRAAHALPPQPQRHPLIVHAICVLLRGAAASIEIGLLTGMQSI